MDKMKETVKPSMDRTRRQLIIGAGLTPLVVTLHSAKVFGQDIKNMQGVSGAAPFSGVIEGSLGPDGSPIQDAENTEYQLYQAIHDNFQPSNGVTLQEYYGAIGSGNLESGWNTNRSGIEWTANYEERIAEVVVEYMKVVNEIESEISEIKAQIANQILLVESVTQEQNIEALSTLPTDNLGLIQDPFKAVGAPNLNAVLPKPEQADGTKSPSSTFGIYEYALEAMNRHYKAISDYNALLKEYDQHTNGTSTELEYYEPSV